MDISVIRKLADIDLAARSIIADAKEEQKKLADEYREKTEAFDRKADTDSERRLEEIRRSLEKENAEAVKKLEADMDQSLAYIEKYYAEQTDARAEEIMASILKV